MVRYENNLPPSVPADNGLMMAVLRRWRTMIVVSILIGLAGAAVVVMSVKQKFQATAAIRVSPVIPSILLSESQVPGVVPMYRNFMNTQADLMTSDKVIQRVTDDLVDKNLFLFEKTNFGIKSLQEEGQLTVAETLDPAIVLKEALNRGILKVTSEKESELIKITMTGTSPKEITRIVNSFLDAYMAVVVSNETDEENQKLNLLQGKQRSLAEKLAEQRAEIREMAEEYGTEALEERQEMMLQRVADIQAELTRAQMEKITLEAKTQLLEKPQLEPITPEELMKLRHDYVNTDLMIQNLTFSIIELQQTLVNEEQVLSASNPKLERKKEALDKLKKQLDGRREELAESFDRMLAEEVVKSDINQLGRLKADLKRTDVYVKRLESMLENEDHQTIELGRKQLAIQYLQSQLGVTKELYDTIQRRIQELQMERKRPGRISIAYYANTMPMPTRKFQYFAVIGFMALGSGVGFAYLKDKADQRLHTPDDVTKGIGIRLVGTTTRATDVKKTLLLKRVADEYRTICANIGLFNGAGIPRKLTVTSPGPEEGKTTLAINLATNIARVGKTVLLIDGDLRKPDITNLLKLAPRKNSLEELLLGKDIDEVVCRTSLPGFDVLTANCRNSSDIYKLVSQPETAQVIDILAHKYDHVIIDAPPVLAVYESLLWAKMCDAVLLTTFADRTASPDLRATIERLNQIDVKILGTVLGNVSIEYCYNPYAYGSFSDVYAGKRSRKKKIFQLPQKQD